MYVLLVSICYLFMLNVTMTSSMTYAMVVSESFRTDRHCMTTSWMYGHFFDCIQLKQLYKPFLRQIICVSTYGAYHWRRWKEENSITERGIHGGVLQIFNTTTHQWKLKKKNHFLWKWPISGTDMHIKNT